MQETSSKSEIYSACRSISKPQTKSDVTDLVALMAALLVLPIAPLLLLVLLCCCWRPLNKRLWLHLDG
jgi:hypothetical protein